MPMEDNFFEELKEAQTVIREMMEDEEEARSIIREQAEIQEIIEKSEMEKDH